jgi:hypothetical protein
LLLPSICSMGLLTGKSFRISKKWVVKMGLFLLSPLLPIGYVVSIYSMRKKMQICYIFTGRSGVAVVSSPQMH